ncbi:hypothetical protein, partial [Gelidibacter salicanalis]|uniref:hypothetical protein n=1 Tax=Gelidibacter salicanalis TaxID=291193 RepID=UPI001F3E14F9
LNCSGDKYSEQSDLALHGTTGTKKIMDDIAVFGSDTNTFLERTKEVFRRCRLHGITLSRKKMAWGSRIKFAG